LTLEEIIQQFIAGIQNTGGLEYIAVFAGIISVWFSRKENIWVYPTGLINTVFYIYLSFKSGLLGEASVNLYYTVMSVYGWIWWSKKDDNKNIVLQISSSDKKEWMAQVGFFLAFYLLIYCALSYLKTNFAPEAIPWADAFASASAFTPLYFVKHYVFTSVYYFILLIMAVFGLIEWIRRSQSHAATTTINRP
jgi:nicotinamide mononucleotide transporter